VDERDAEAAAGLEDAARLADRAVGVVHVLERHESDDEVGGAVLERQRGAAREHVLAVRIGLARVGHHRRSGIDRDDLVAERLQVPCEASLATADVESAPAGWGQELEEGLAVEPPEAVGAATPPPPAPIGRLGLPPAA